MGRIIHTLFIIFEFFYISPSSWPTSETQGYLLYHHSRNLTEKRNIKSLNLGFLTVRCYRVLLSFFSGASFQKKEVGFLILSPSDRSVYENLLFTGGGGFGHFRLTPHIRRWKQFDILCTGSHRWTTLRL